MTKLPPHWTRNAPLARYLNASEKPLPRWTRNAPLARYLNVSDMTVWRWARNPALNFPPPTVINNVEYRDLNLIDEWMRSRITHLVDETA